MRVKAKPHLNVRSGPGENFRPVARLGDNVDIDVVEVHGGWSWVKPGLGWVDNRYLVPDIPTSVQPFRAPRGLAEIIRVYGKPGNPDCYGGYCELPAPLKLAWENGTQEGFACHIKVAPIFNQVFAAIHAAGHWDKITYYGGCYNLRKKTANPNQWSTHSWGIAVDLDPLTNGFGVKNYTMHPAIIAIFKEHGFTAGADWRVPDAMHYQYAGGY